MEAEIQIVKLYKQGASVLEIYHTIKSQKRWTMKQIARVIAKNEMTYLREQKVHDEIFILVPSLMNYTFKINKENEDEI